MKLIKKKASKEFFSFAKKFKFSKITFPKFGFPVVVRCGSDDDGPFFRIVSAGL